MSYQYDYVLKGMSKTVNGKQIIKETWLSFLQGAKIGIIGHNGAGKSTILKIIAGIDKEFDGEAFAAPNIKIGYLPQEPHLNPDKNIFENILEGLTEKQELIKKFEEISARFTENIDEDEMNKLLEEQAELQTHIDKVGAWDIEREIEMAMYALRCPPKEAKVTEISGGEKRRVALCKLLLEKPNMLLLDEPTNHLDAESISWLENYLKNYKGTVIAITHDRYFLDTVAEWILEIDRGTCVPWHSNYSDWLKQKAEKLAIEEKEESWRRKQLKEEFEWIKQSPKARQAKSKARINTYEELLQKKQEKIQDIAQIIIPNGPKLGNVVIEGENLGKELENGKILFKNFNFKIPPGAVVGIIGANGVGKTTLFNIISGKTAATSGTIKLGSTVKLGYVDQSRDHLVDSNNIWEEVSGGLDEIILGERTIKSRAYLAAFNFKGSDQQKKIGELSGGERNRVHLAKLLKEGANVLLLDEPSNDLDVDTLRALETAIIDFAGCVLVISHDRWFLDRVATHIISFDKNASNIIGKTETPVWFEGNYQDYHNYMYSLGYDASNIKYNHKKFN